MWRFAVSSMEKAHKGGQRSQLGIGEPARLLCLLLSLNFRIWQGNQCLIKWPRAAYPMIARSSGHWGSAITPISLANRCAALEPPVFAVSLIRLRIYATRAADRPLRQILKPSAHADNNP